MVRRLPVLSSTADEDERPTWQWTAIGVLFVYAIWAPLAVLGTWVNRRIVDRLLGDGTPEDLARLVGEASPARRAELWLATTAVPVATYAFACWAAGALIGRFGARVLPAHAAIAGATASVVGAALTLLAASWLAAAASLAVLLPLGVLVAWMGGRFGIRLRTQAFFRAPPPPR
jgi:hypothetical protein